MKLPKIIFTDIDGVWTDGGMYYDQTGNEWKKFNTSDSWGVAFCRAFDIEVIILTGEDTEIVKRRAAKLRIENCFLGVKDKLKLATELIERRGLTWEDIAFIGDDFNDIGLLRKVGLPGCPNNAPEYIKNLVKFRGKKNGGDGAFREFVEYILCMQYSMDEIVSRVAH
jgi:3-deoxy-D-manno-octulosonate 8-phosphate phosphatase (KDO 8-P phosphatase)